MFQLKFEEDFTNITRDIPYWKTEENIPNEIRLFFKKNMKIQAIYDNDTEKLYCSNCSTELDEQSYCKNCDLQYTKITNDDIEEYKQNMDYYYNNSDVVWSENIEKTTTWNTKTSYYVFDVIEHQVFLYLITIHTNCYYHRYIKNVQKRQEYEIEKVFFIEKNGFTDLITNKYYDFLECYKNIYQEECSSDYEDIFDFHYTSYGPLYVENLDQLKDTIYQYSFLWEAKEYLKKETMTITQLIFLPLYFFQFEYLIKLKLFALAFESPHIFQKEKSFQKIFGVDKKYLPFMVEHNITSSELEILKLYQTQNIENIRFFLDFPFYRMTLKEFLHDTEIDLQQLKKYFENINLSSTYLNEYVDYILMAKQLGYDIKDKKIKYPKNLIEEHDKLYLQIEMIKDPTINKKIKNLSTLLKLNYYEDEKYIIFPACSIESLIKESEQQHNCVRTYSNRFANNDCQIYFMRKKDNTDTSFVTIEVQNGKVVQARTKFNNLPAQEINQILKKWETTLIPIINIEEKENTP